MERKIKILIADDHQIFREGLILILAKYSFIEVLGEAANGAELIKLTRRLEPDVILTDVLMPEMDGAEATRLLHAEWPGLGIIALSILEGPGLIEEMMAAGARGYLHKNADKEDLVRAIEVVNDGGSYFSKPAAAQLRALISQAGYDPFLHHHKPSFSDREREVIRLICEQLSSKEIATRLKIHRRSVEGHRERIQKKIGARNMVGIVVYAIRHGLVRID